MTLYLFCALIVLLAAAIALVGAVLLDLARKDD